MIWLTIEDGDKFLCNAEHIIAVMQYGASSKVAVAELGHFFVRESVNEIARLIQESKA